MSRLKKSFGQHFLHDKGVIEKIASAVPFEGADVIVEVGPGGGALTNELQKRLQPEQSLVLVEADKDLVPSLEERFPDTTIVQADAAKVSFEELVVAQKKGGTWVLVGNLPYNAAAAILQNALFSDHPPRQVVMMVQKEQGDRMLASAGDMSLLSLMVQLSMQGKRIMTVGSGAFQPPPNVDSIVLLLEQRSEILPAKDRERVMQFAKVGFSSRRKQLRNTLRSIADAEEIGNALKQIGKKESARPQELSVRDWIALEKILVR